MKYLRDMCNDPITIRESLIALTVLATIFSVLQRSKALVEGSGQDRTGGEKVEPGELRGKVLGG